MKKKIIHFEDVASVVKYVREGIEDDFGEENVEVEGCEFEKDADDFVDDGDNSKGVALIIIDMMIAYHCDDEIIIPVEVLKSGSFEAGFRLIRKLRASPAWQSIPIVIYSSVDKHEVEATLSAQAISDISVCQKDNSLERLLEYVKSLTGLKLISR